MRKHNKRIIGILLAMILLFALATSCSSDNKPSGDADKVEVNTDFSGKLTVLVYDWVDKDGIDPTTLEEVKGYDSIIQEFRDMYPNIELEFINTVSGSLVTLTTAMSASGELDVGFVNYCPEFAEDLAPYIARDQQALSDLAVTNTQLYLDAESLVTIGMPLKAKVFAIYFDKKIFDEWGVDYLSPVTTWDEIANKASQMTGTNPVTGEQNYGFWSALGGDPQDIFSNYMSRVSGLTIPYEFTGSGLNDVLYTFTTDNQWSNAVHWYKDMIPFMHPGVFEYSGYEIFGTQENNIAILQISWTDGIIKQAEAGGTTRVEGEDNRIGFVDMPLNPAGQFSMYFGGSTGLGIVNSSNNKDAAWEFIKWSCTSPTLGQYLYESIGYIPVNYTALALTGFKAAYPDIAEIMNNQPRNFVLSHMPPEGAYPIVDKYTVLFWSGAMTYEEATSAMQDELQAIIDTLE